MTHARVMTWRYRQVAGWSSLIASALLLGSLLDAGVTSGTSGMVEAEPTRILALPATAALPDGKNVGARLLSDVSEASCDVAARQPLYAGLNTWVGQTPSDCEISGP